MSCDDELNSKCSYCKCLSTITQKVRHPTAAPQLIDDIVKKYFCAKMGQGSSCSLFSAANQSVYSMDKRLLYWSKIVEERKKLACRISKVTGKRLSHVLYNQLEEHRNVQNVKRVIDFAERLNPTKLSMRKETHLKNVNLFETLPKSEKMQVANLEIVEMPKISRDEQWITQVGDNAFLSSKFLQQKIESTSFSKIIEYYPETDGLEIVGKRIHKHPRTKIEYDSDFKFSSLSSESCSESIDFTEYLLQINDCTFKIDNKPKKPLKFDLKFKCLPFEYQTYNVCRIHNIGRRPIWFMWKKIKPNGFAFMPPTETVFQLNQKSFRLQCYDSIAVKITFIPTHRIFCTEQWQLITEPHFFEESKSIQLTVSGECYIPEYFVRSISQDILRLLVSRVFPEKVCTQTAIAECKIFEKLNPAFKCNYEDLQIFKGMYRRFENKCRSTNWDYKLSTLKSLIEDSRSFTKRKQGLSALSCVIQEIRLRISYDDQEIKIQLARSAIVHFLDNWEDKAIETIRSVATTVIDVLTIRMHFLLEELEQCKSVEDKRKIIRHQVLYVQMYCCFCNLIEEIVSCIENCLLLEK